MRRGRRHLGAALATTAVVALTLALGSVGGAQTTPPAAGSGASVLNLAAQSGWVAPTGNFAISVQAPALPDGTRIVARLYNAVTTSARLEQTGAGDNLGSPIHSVTVPANQVPRDGTTLMLSYPLVSSGDAAPYGFRIGPAGVYPFSIGLLSADGEETDRIVTHLIRLPAATTTRSPLAVSLVVPVHAGVAHQPAGVTSLDPDALAGIQGLIAQLNRQPGVPLTLTPTPETVDALAERDRSLGTSTLVSSLARAAGSGRQVISGTYVDVDQGAWVNQGLSSSLGAQFEAGAATLQTQLRTPLDRQTLVADRTTTPEVLTDQSGRGTNQVVVPSDQLAPLSGRDNDETLTQTFDLATSNEDRLPAMATDSVLSGMLVEGDNATLAAHEVLAELALISQDQTRYQPCNLASSGSPGCSRGIGLQLPTDASRAQTAAGVLLDAFADRDGTAGVATTVPGRPIASAVTVNDFLKVVDRASASFRTRPTGGAVLVRELAPTTPSSLGSYPADLRTTSTSVAGFRSMTLPDDPKGSDIATSLEQVVLTSGAVELDDATRTSYLDGARATVEAQVAFITTTDQVVVTLTSSRADVPLSINNGLDYPVQVALRLASPKLEFPDGATQTIHLEPRTPTRIEIPVETRASGSFVMEASIWSPDGAAHVASSRFIIRSTAVSGVGLALTIAAGLFLVLWWGRHFRNTRRDKRLVASGHPVLRSPPEPGDPASSSSPSSHPDAGSTPGLDA